MKINVVKPENKYESLKEFFEDKIKPGVIVVLGESNDYQHVITKVIKFYDDGFKAEYICLQTNVLNTSTTFNYLNYNIAESIDITLITKPFLS